MPQKQHRSTSQDRPSLSSSPHQQSRGFGSNQERASTLSSRSRLQPNAFQREGLRPAVLTKALTAYRAARRDGKTTSPIFTVIDFELPSTMKRMWVMNIETGALLHHEQVTHGTNSDRDNDGRVDPGGLSNTNMSKQSNIGLLKTAETYHSSKFNGTSMRMDGLEPGFNDNARDRAIVMHPASYADREEGQKMGRSWGCPALDPDVSGDIIETIKDGTLIFQYYPDEKWLEESQYLN
jgi:hypothetical protein